MFTTSKWLIISILWVSACQQKVTSEQEAILTNGGKGKYWDLVYENVGDSIIDIARVRRNSIRKVTDYCDYFTINNVAMHYRNIDMTTIVDKGSDDNLYNPSKYKLINDSLNFEGYLYRVLVLDKEALVIKTRFKNGKEMTKVYLPSKHQHKKHVDGK